MCISYLLQVFNHAGSPCRRCSLMTCTCLCCFSSRSNVTPQSRLDLKLWSCHTLRKELLGSATIDLLDTLRTYDGKSESTSGGISKQMPPYSCQCKVHPAVASAVRTTIFAECKVKWNEMLRIKKRGRFTSGGLAGVGLSWRSSWTAGISISIRTRTSTSWRRVSSLMTFLF